MLSAIVVACGYMVAVFGFFSKVEEIVPNAFKERLGATLENTGHINKESAVNYFPQLFNSFFGERHWTLKCVVRSCTLSISVTAFMLVVWLVRYQDDIPYTIRVTGLNSLIFSVLASIFLLCIPNYISLYKSRILMKVMRQRSFSTIGVLFIAIADFFLSILVLILFIYLMSHLFQYSILGDFLSSINPSMAFSYDSINTWYIDQAFLLRDPYSVDFPDSIPAGVFFYATAITSIWLLLFIVSTSLIRLLSRISLLKTVLNLKEHPIKSIGLIAGLITALAYVAGSAVAAI